MEENKLKGIAGQLLTIIPLFKKKLVKPVGGMIHGGLKPSEFFVLVLLCENDGFTMTELANKLEISKTNLTPMVDKLIECNYIRRFRDDKDRRIIRVEICNDGKKLLDDHHKIFEDLLTEKLASLSEEDLNELSQSIEKFQHIVMKL